jgi:thiamine transporter ThiT
MEPIASGQRGQVMFALDVNGGAVLLAVVVAFIVLCTLASLIIKELYRRR